MTSLAQLAAAQRDYRARNPGKVAAVRCAYRERNRARLAAYDKARAQKQALLEAAARAAGRTDCVRCGMEFPSPGVRRRHWRDVHRASA